MNIVVILRNKDMFDILKQNLGGFEAMHYLSTEDFLADMEFVKKNKSESDDNSLNNLQKNKINFLNDDLALIVNAGIEINSDILSFENIKLLQQFGIGYENVDVDYASKQNIPIFVTPTKNSANATSCAELALFFSLSLARDYNGCINSINHGIANQPMGEIISGKRFGVIGLGGLGLETIRLLKSFDTVIYGIKHSKPEFGLAKKLDIEFVGTYGEDFKNILPLLDFIIFTLPLNPETENMMNEEAVSSCKTGVYIINVGRAGVINRQALINGLKSGKIKGAGLDVFWEEPVHISDDIFHFNVIATPHIGGATTESIEGISRQCVSNIKGFIEKGDLTNCVNKEKLNFKI